MFDILINKKYPLDKNYIPSNLVNTNTKSKGHLDKNHLVLIKDIVLASFNEMKKDALKLGYDIEIDSGYRSYDYQEKILMAKLKEKGIKIYKTLAIPGTSEHQSGLAIDFCLFIDGIYCDEINDKQEETKWIHQNCYKYGFILRYPKNKENITGYSYEPWHLRYVGNDLAEFIFKKNITLEEYYETYKNKKFL